MLAWNGMMKPSSKIDDLGGFLFLTKLRILNLACCQVVAFCQWWLSMVMMMFMMTFMSMAAMPMSSLASFLDPMMMTWVTLSMFVVMVSSGGFRSTIYCHISYVHFNFFFFQLPFQHFIIFNWYHANRARLVIVLGSIEIILKMTYNVDIWLRSPVIIN